MSESGKTRCTILQMWPGFLLVARHDVPAKSAVFQNGSNPKRNTSGVPKQTKIAA